METLNDFIHKNLESCPELSEYSEIIIKITNSYSKERPDISIEACKSLIEGISKSIYFNLDKNNTNPKIWNRSYLKDKFLKAIEVLDLDNYEKEFVKKNSELVFKLGQIRNERGDLAHGQAYPKDSYSDIYFTKFIILWTEGLCYFLFTKYIEYMKNEKEEIFTYGDEQIEEFNNYLDELNPMEYISYSKALKEQDALQYESIMDEYFTNLEVEK